MEPDDDRVWPETDDDHDPIASGIRRPGRLRAVLVTFALIAVLGLIVIGAIRLWQA